MSFLGDLFARAGQVEPRALDKALGRSAESWLAMQANHDLWHAKKTVRLTAG